MNNIKIYNIKWAAVYGNNVVYIVCCAENKIATSSSILIFFFAFFFSVRSQFILFHVKMLDSN